VEDKGCFLGQQLLDVIGFGKKDLIQLIRIIIDVDCTLYMTRLEFFLIPAVYNQEVRSSGRISHFCIHQVSKILHGDGILQPVLSV